MSRVYVALLFCIFCYETVKSENGTDNDQQYCTIKTKSGQIRGKRNRTLFDGKLYYSFRGIPFAEPPTNELRFKVIKTTIHTNFSNIKFSRFRRLRNKSIHGTAHQMHSIFAMIVFNRILMEKYLLAQKIAYT